VECLDADFAGEHANQAKECCITAGMKYEIIDKCSTNDQEGIAFLAHAVATTSKVHSAPTYDIGRDRYSGVKNSTQFLQLVCPPLVCLDQYFKPVSIISAKHHRHGHGSRRLLPKEDTTLHVPSACSRRLLVEEPVAGHGYVISTMHATAEWAAVYGWMVVLALLVRPAAADC
jgi:hypothetical protein